MGVTRVSFHWDGILPVSKGVWKILAKSEHRILASSFRILGEILSGPEALFSGFSPLRSFSTPFVSTTTSGGEGTLASFFVGMLPYHILPHEVAGVCVVLIYVKYVSMA